MLLDIIFSLDSVITAVGLSDHLLFYYDGGSRYCRGRHDVCGTAHRRGFCRSSSVGKILALSFLIWLALHDSGSFDVHVRGTIYFAMFFSIAVEPEPVSVIKESAGNLSRSPPGANTHFISFSSHS